MPDTPHDGPQGPRDGTGSEIPDQRTERADGGRAEDLPHQAAPVAARAGRRNAGRRRVLVGDERFRI
ncbi:hypothetical protein [Streptomyces sp. HC307]|uniref:hypothetical protein n=1 Tax=Streptomyces flavusporus TaxID=3385496 RepID=UPI0039174CB2